MWGGRQEGVIPPDVRDEIILWFREQGRMASVHWNEVMRCAEIRVRLRDDDPRMQLHREGRWGEGPDGTRVRLRVPDYEPIWLHFEDRDGTLKGYNLAELGASGVRNVLDQGNLHSGRGEFRNLYESIKAVNARNERTQDEIKKAALEGVRERSHLKRRAILQLPQVPVGINLKP